MKKTTTDLRPWTRVEVEWQDHFRDDGAVSVQKWIKEYKTCIRRTVGYYVGEDAVHWYVVWTNDLGAHANDSEGELMDGEHIGAFLKAVCKLTPLAPAKKSP